MYIYLYTHILCNYLFCTQRSNIVSHFSQERVKEREKEKAFISHVYVHGGEGEKVRAFISHVCMRGERRESIENHINTVQKDVYCNKK